jgi:hypothetical protein
MKAKVKHNGRLAGWTDNQIDAFNRAVRGALRGKLIKSDSVHPRVRHTLEGRKLVFDLNGKLCVTANGLAVARSCGWIKPNES